MLPHSSGSIGTTVSAPLDSATILIPPRSVYESANSVSLGSFTPSDSLRDANGSIGTLSIPRLRVSANVYAGETLENLARGIGHFNMTSAWHGNVGLSAHNRGIANFFGQIHTLREGDEIVYTTNLGTRTYAVFLVRQIHETDFSYLGWTNDNILTLVTCVRDIPELRYVVQAREI
jgi:sortase A